MNRVVSSTSSTGVPAATSCVAASIDAPANTSSDIATVACGGMPLATMATPVVRPKGTTANSTGSAARRPPRKAARSNAGVAIGRSGG